MGTAFAHDSFLEVNVSRAFQWKKGLQWCREVLDRREYSWYALCSSLSCPCSPISFSLVALRCVTRTQMKPILNASRTPSSVSPAVSIAVVIKTQSKTYYSLLPKYRFAKKSICLNKKQMLRISNLKTQMTESHHNLLATHWDLEIAVTLRGRMILNRR
jgi:hypothetical protein